MFFENYEKKFKLMRMSLMRLCHSAKCSEVFCRYDSAESTFVRKSVSPHSVEQLCGVMNYDGFALIVSCRFPLFVLIKFEPQ